MVLDNGEGHKENPPVHCLKTNFGNYPKPSSDLCVYLDFVIAYSNQ